MEIRPPGPMNPAPSLKASPASPSLPPSPEDRLTAAEPGPPAQGQSLSGDIRVHRVHSQILGNDRQVWVYLPPGYAEHPERRYPVLYLQDGQNVFDRGTAFGGVEWQADEAAERLIHNHQMQDTIMVAVANTPDRMSEYTPVPDPKYGGGHADLYGRFLIEELKPMIDTRYRTLKGPETTGLMGSSLGALVSLYLAFNHPGTFGLVGALSPSLWWAGRDMIKEVAAHHGPGPRKIWLDMGTQEGDGEDEDHNGVPDVLDDLRAMGSALVDQGYEPGQSLLYHEIPGGQHKEASWADRVDAVLASLYPPR